MSKVSSQIKEIAKTVETKILKKKTPELKMPLRSLSNVTYNEKDGYFEIIGKFKLRTLSAGIPFRVYSKSLPLSIPFWIINSI